MKVLTYIIGMFTLPVVVYVLCLAKFGMLVGGTAGLGAGIVTALLWTAIAKWSRT